MSVNSGYQPLFDVFVFCGECFDLSCVYYFAFCESRLVLRAVSDRIGRKRA